MATEKPGAPSKPTKRSGYESRDEAVLAAIEEIWELSQLQGWEYGGVVYQVGTGNSARYGYTQALTNQSRFHVKISLRKVPAAKEGTKIVGVYHTHVARDVWDSRLFLATSNLRQEKDKSESFGDKVFAERHQCPVVVADEKGWVTEHIPAEKHRGRTVAGRTRTIGRVDDSSALLDASRSNSANSSLRGSGQGKLFPRAVCRPRKERIRGMLKWRNKY